MFLLVPVSDTIRYTNICLTSAKIFNSCRICESGTYDSLLALQNRWMGRLFATLTLRNKNKNENKKKESGHQWTKTKQKQWTKPRFQLLITPDTSHSYTLVTWRGWLLLLLSLLFRHELIATMQSMVTGPAPINMEQKITSGGTAK